VLDSWAAATSTILGAGQPPEGRGAGGQRSTALSNPRRPCVALAAMLSALAVGIDTDCPLPGLTRGER
jgi:hypothetical protein